MKGCVNPRARYTQPYQMTSDPRDKLLLHTGIENIIMYCKSRCQRASLSRVSAQLKSGLSMLIPCTAVTEVPRLEEWFLANTHPSQALIARYTEDLNSQPYRHKFPRLEQKNIQFWFKNR